MESAMADVAIRQVTFTPKHAHLPHAIVRPWPIIQVVLGGLLCAYLMGWIQDFQRIRDLRAEPVALSKIVITKKEAWDRIHAMRKRQGSARGQARIPLRPVVMAASSPSAQADQLPDGS